MRKNYIVFVVLSFSVLFSYSQNKSVRLVGSIQDTQGFGLPFVTISIPSLGKGTISNENGEFEFTLRESSLNQEIKFEMMGFKNSILTASEFLKLENHTLVMKEGGAEELEEVLIEQDAVIIEKALAKIKDNFIKKKHKLAGVYKRATIEDNKAAHMIEHLLYLEDRAGLTEYSKIKVVGSRESLDYRKNREQQSKHAILYANRLDPLRNDLLTLKKLNWEKVDDTEIDDRLILVLKANNPKYKNIKIYVDPKEYKIFQLEYSSGKMRYLNKYKTNNNNKLYLSYHQRVYNWQLLKEYNPKAPETYNGTVFKHEFITLRVNSKKYKQFSTTRNVGLSDLTQIKAPYKESTWKSISLPPDSKFYKRIKQELVSHKDISITDQYKRSNFAKYKLKDLIGQN